MSKVEPNRNVYVRHRYVPKIFGEWDKQNQYEGLSIVTHQGNSYTSKKQVPVGIDILNEEFWVVTGNYNAQVENYREEIKNTVSGIAHVLKVNSPENIGIDINTKYNELSNGDKILIHPGKYKTSETIILYKGINVDFTGVEIVYTGNTTALVVGNPATEFHGLEITLPFIYNYELDWSKDTTGVHIYNIYTSNFYNIEIENFKKGLIVDVRNNMEDTYNSFYFKRIVDNEKSLILTSSAKGWSNDNRFYGGRFGWTSAVRPYMSNKNMHVFFEYIDYSQNNNRFYGCSFESGANMGVEHAVYAEDGRMNYFRECRYELVKKIHIEKGLDFQFTDGFGLETVEFTGVDPSVIKSNQRNFEKRWSPLQLTNGTGV